MDIKLLRIAVYLYIIGGIVITTDINAVKVVANLLICWLIFWDIKFHWRNR